MANLPSVKTKITVEVSRYRSAVSEFLAQTLGKSINWLIDDNQNIRDGVNASLAQLSGYTLTGWEQITIGGSGAATIGAGEYWVVFELASVTLVGGGGTQNRFVLNGVHGPGGAFISGIGNVIYVLKFKEISADPI